MGFLYIVNFSISPKHHDGRFERVVRTTPVTPVDTVSIAGVISFQVVAIQVCGVTIPVIE